MTQAELKAHLAALRAQVDDALASLDQVAKETKYLEAHIATKAHAIIQTLSTPFEDPADTEVGEIVTGPASEQPNAPTTTAPSSGG